MISEGRLPLCNTSSEAGALPSEVRIENDSDRKFAKSIFSKFFWKPLFSPFYGTLFIISRKYFFGFSKSAPTPRYTILDSRLPPCYAISEEGFPFATRAWKREPCLQRYVSIMTRTKNFLSQFFSKFFWKPLFSTFYGTLFIISRKYFFGFSKSAPTPSIPLAGLIKKSSFSWTNQKSPAVAGLFY